MTRRYKLDPPARLVDRDGAVVGVLTSVSLDIYAGAPDGGQGAEVVEEQQLLRDIALEGGVGETKSDPTEERVAGLWAHWLTLRQPRRSTMGTGSARQLRRAITAGYSDDDIKRAMAALMASDWHAERNLQTLSTIFATKPGGPTFEDQVDTWIARADDGVSVDPQSASSGLINSAKDTVRRTWALRLDSSVAREHFEDAMRTLAQYGITVHDNNGRPEFS